LSPFRIEKVDKFIDFLNNNSVEGYKKNVGYIKMVMRNFYRVFIFIGDPFL